MAAANLTGGGLGQAASELVREMQKAQAEMQKPGDGARPQGQQFQQAIDQKGLELQTTQAAQSQSSRQAAEATQLSRGVSDAKLGQLHREARDQRQAPRVTKVGSFERLQESRLGVMIENLVRGQDKMTEIMNIALSGRQFSPSELLAMQAGVYRFSQELDLTSKVVEKATGGIKQTLNTQV